MPLAVVAACVAQSAGCRPPTNPSPNPLAERDILVQFPGDGRPHHAEIRTRGLVVHEGETALGVVDAAGLARSADSIELIRLVNPGVDIYDLRAGQTVIIPDLRIAANETASVFVDDSRKRAMRAAIAAALAHADGLPGNEGSLKIARILRDIAERVDKRMLVTTPQFIDLVRAEAEFFGKLATTPAAPQLGGLAAQLEEQTASFLDEHKGDQPVDHDRVSIDVRVFRRPGRAATPAEVREQYRVWYSAKVLFDERDQHSGFPIGGLAPTVSELSPGGYVFWATEGSLAFPRRGTLLDVHLNRGDRHVHVDIVFDEESH